MDHRETGFSYKLLLSKPSFLPSFYGLQFEKSRNSLSSKLDTMAESVEPKISVIWTLPFHYMNLTDQQKSDIEQLATKVPSSVELQGCS